VEVPGNYILTRSEQLILYTNGSSIGMLNVTGCLEMNGEVFIIIDNHTEVEFNKNYSIIQYESLCQGKSNPTYHVITNTTDCKKQISASANTDPTKNEVFVLFGPSNSCNGFPTWGAIILGTVLGLLVLLIILAVIFIPRVRRKVFPYRYKSNPRTSIAMGNIES